MADSYLLTRRAYLSNRRDQALLMLRQELTELAGSQRRAEAGRRHRRAPGAGRSTSIQLTPTTAGEVIRTREPVRVRRQFEVPVTTGAGIGLAAGVLVLAMFPGWRPRVEAKAVSESMTVPPGRPREIWTRFTVDPLATPLAAWLARSRHVTPNRVTGVAILLALGSAACFAAGCSSSAECCSSCASSSTAWTGRWPARRAAARREVPSSTWPPTWAGSPSSSPPCPGRCCVATTYNELVPVALLGAMVFYNWVLAYRKQLAAALGLGDGGADHTRQVLGAGRPPMGGVLPPAQHVAGTLGARGRDRDARARTDLPSLRLGRLRARGRTLLLPGRRCAEHAFASGGWRGEPTTHEGARGHDD